MAVQDTGRVCSTHDCDCWDADPELPCWPCYRDGFDKPNPNAPVDEDGKEVEDGTPHRSESVDFGYGNSTGGQDL